MKLPGIVTLCLTCVFPPMCHVAEVDLELDIYLVKAGFDRLVLLPLPPEYWDCKP